MNEKHLLHHSNIIYNYTVIIFINSGLLVLLQMYCPVAVHYSSANMHRTEPHMYCTVPVMCHWLQWKLPVE